MSIEERVKEHKIKNPLSIEEYKNCYVCSANDEIKAKFLEHCHDFKVSKWALVEFLKGELNGITTQLKEILNKCIGIDTWNSLITYLDKDNKPPDLERLRLK